MPAGHVAPPLKPDGGALYCAATRLYAHSPPGLGRWLNSLVRSTSVGAAVSLCDGASEPQARRHARAASLTPHRSPVRPKATAFRLTARAPPFVLSRGGQGEGPDHPLTIGPQRAGIVNGEHQTPSRPG
jgi:hypothetical protein